MGIKESYIKILKKGKRIPVKKLKTIYFEIFKKLFLTDEDALIISDNLIQNDLRGVYSHGIMRLPILVENIERKIINPRAKIKVVKDFKGTALIDGNNGIGQVISWKAMDIALKKAKEYGVSGVGVFHSNHSNLMATYAMKALEQDMIGFYLSVGSSNIMAPYGGYDARLGNNPFGIAIPTGSMWEFPIVLDMACSKNAMGWVMLAVKEGKKSIPKDFALDNMGNPTTDPKEALHGTLLPFGGYKGYGLAIIVGVLGSILTSGAIGEDFNNLIEEVSHEQNIGHFMGAIDIGRFIKIDEFKRRIDKLIMYLKSSRKLKNIKKIYVPGEKEYEHYKVNVIKGIPIAPITLESIKEITNKYSVNVDF